MVRIFCHDGHDWWPTYVSLQGELSVSLQALLAPIIPLDWTPSMHLERIQPKYLAPGFLPTYFKYEQVSHYQRYRVFSHQNKTRRFNSIIVI